MEKIPVQEVRGGFKRRRATATFFVTDFSQMQNPPANFAVRRRALVFRVSADFSQRYS
jgi:hypothetical protein